MDKKNHMKQRMIDGKLYMPGELPTTDKRDIMNEFNQTTHHELEKRSQLLKKLIGGIGKNGYIEPPFYCDHGFNIFLGDNFYANTGLIILDECKVTIGNNVFIGPRTSFYCATHPIDAFVRNLLLESGKPITVGNDVWIGGSVTICPGVTVGNNVVIAAGSVVVKDVPDNVIIGGNPAKLIREITLKDHEYWMEQMREFQNDTGITRDPDNYNNV